MAASPIGSCIINHDPWLNYCIKNHASIRYVLCPQALTYKHILQREKDKTIDLLSYCLDTSEANTYILVLKVFLSNTEKITTGYISHYYNMWGCIVFNWPIPVYVIERIYIYIAHVIIMINSEVSTFPIVIIFFHGCVPEMLAGLGSNTFYQIQIQIQKFWFFKYKYKYFAKLWFKYKYKYKYIDSNTNTNTFNQIYPSKLFGSKIGQFY